MRTIRIFAFFLFQMLINRFKLSDDIDRNYSIARGICKRTLNTARITVEGIGSENIPNASAVVIIPNHKSLFDIMALLLTVDRTMSVVAAKEMYIPVLKKYIDAIDCVQIDRFIKTQVDKKEVVRTQKEISNHLISGHCVTIFPEGRLILGDDLGEFKTASFKAPLRTDAYIVPTYIHGSEGINRKGRWFFFPKTHITVTFGKPIKPSETDATSTAELSDIVRDKIQELKDGY